MPGITEATPYHERKLFLYTFFIFYIENIARLDIISLQIICQLDFAVYNRKKHSDKSTCYIYLIT